MQAVKWVVSKLQGGKTASFCRNISGREVTGGQISIPIFHGNSITHGFLDPSAFPEKAAVFFDFLRPPNVGDRDRGCQISEN